VLPSSTLDTPRRKNRRKLNRFREKSGKCWNPFGPAALMSQDPSGWCFRNLELDVPGIFFFGQVR
jgi:hypothetical protein